MCGLTLEESKDKTNVAFHSFVSRTARVRCARVDSCGNTPSEWSGVVVVLNQVLRPVNRGPERIERVDKQARRSKRRSTPDMKLQGVCTRRGESPQRNGQRTARGTGESDGGCARAGRGVLASE